MCSEDRKLSCIKSLLSEWRLVAPAYIDYDDKDKRDVVDILQNRIELATSLIELMAEQLGSDECEGRQEWLANTQQMPS